MDESFNKVVEDFRQFIQRQRCCGKIVWVGPDDVVVSGKDVYIRVADPLANENRAKQSFDAGMNRELGILMAILCATDDETYCYTWAPRDEQEAMEHLMLRGPRFSALAENSRRKGVLVTNLLMWMWIYPGLTPWATVVSRLRRWLSESIRTPSQSNFVNFMTECKHKGQRSRSFTFSLSRSFGSRFRMTLFWRGRFGGTAATQN